MFNRSDISLLLSILINSYSFYSWTFYGEDEAKVQLTESPQLQDRVGSILGLTLPIDEITRAQFLEKILANLWILVGSYSLDLSTHIETRYYLIDEVGSKLVIHFIHLFQNQSLIVFFIE